MDRPVFTQFVAFMNPASTHAAEAQERVKALRQLYPGTPCTIIKTSRKGRTANKQILRDAAHLLGPHTLLCIGAGDGTVGLVVETLVSDRHMPADARRTPILPIWGGNANDLAHMLNGTPPKAGLKALLEQGKIIPIHPLDCKLTSQHHNVRHHIAVCYASFGATAFAAAKLNEPSHRHNPLQQLPGGRQLSEIISGFSALVGAPTFRIKEADTPHVVYERTFTNGSRFAKIDRLPLRLTDEMFYLHTLEDKGLLAAIPRIVELVQKRFSGKFLHDHARFTVEELTLAQFDGETTEIAAGTHVEVTLSERPFYALSTILP